MDEENIHVVVRIRPLMLSEKKAGEFPIVEASSSGKEVQVKVNICDVEKKCISLLISPDWTIRCSIVSLQSVKMLPLNETLF